MAERRRQYIGGVIVYILNRQDGTNFADFWEVYITLLIQKVNSMRQYIGAVRAKNSILSPLCLFVETMPINPFLSIKKSGLDILLTGYNNLTLQTY